MNQITKCIILTLMANPWVILAAVVRFGSTGHLIQKLFQMKTTTEQLVAAVDSSFPDYLESEN